MDLPPLLLRRDLRARGCSETESRHRVAHLERLAPGAYARTSGLDPERKHVLRAQAVVRRLLHVAASHATAAVLWELPTLPDHLARVHVSPTHQRRGRPKSSTRHRMYSHPVAPERQREAAGVPVSDPGLTVVNCAQSLDLDWAVVIADAAVHRGLVTIDELADAARGLPRQPGVRRARLLPNLASGLSESPGESLLRQRVRRTGLEFRQQVSIASWRVDLLVAGGLILEFDGRAKYELHGDPARAHWAEKRRHDGLVELGYEVLHVGWADLWDEPALDRRIRGGLRRWHRRAGRQHHAVVLGAPVIHQR